jgi:hypothetical protein
MSNSIPFPSWNRVGSDIVGVGARAAAFESLVWAWRESTRGEDGLDDQGFDCNGRDSDGYHYSDAVFRRSARWEDELTDSEGRAGQ